MENNLLGELRIMNDFNIKPNYSELGRKYGMDRHTVKKYHVNGKIPDRKETVRKSKWDDYYDKIALLMELPGATKIAVYQALVYQYNDKFPGNYNSFRIYAYISCNIQIIDLLTSQCSYML